MSGNVALSPTFAPGAGGHAGDAMKDAVEFVRGHNRKRGKRIRRRATASDITHVIFNLVHCIAKLVFDFRI